VGMRVVYMRSCVRAYSRKREKDGRRELLSVENEGRRGWDDERGVPAKGSRDKDERAEKAVANLAK